MLQDGETALHMATKVGNIEVVKLLIDYGIAVDIKTKVTTVEALNFRGIRQGICSIMCFT